MSVKHETHAYQILPIYTADVSGICSALYELGGMVVIHDPSGCNSTYNTHDETRWYDRDSLIFISGLTEIDAIMGNDARFMQQIADAAAKLHPRFVALVRSPIPYMNGTDFYGIAKLLTKRLGIPVFFVPSNGMHDYIRGVGDALTTYAKHMLPGNAPGQEREEGIIARKTAAGKDIRVNLLGVTPLDFPVEGSVQALKSLLGDAGMKVNSCWALETSAEELEKTAQAQVNLVVSAAGLSLAKYLEERWQIPYVAGLPIGAMKQVVLDCLRKSAEDRKHRIAYEAEHMKTAEQRLSSAAKEKVIVVGEAVMAESIAADLWLRFGKRADVVCPLECSEELFTETTKYVIDESAAAEALADAAYVIADPLYQYVLEGNSKLYGVPHLAFSGRCFLKQAKNIFAEEDNYGFE